MVLGLYFTTFVTKIIELCIGMKNRRLSKISTVSSSSRIDLRVYQIFKFKKIHSSSMIKHRNKWNKIRKLIFTKFFKLKIIHHISIEQKMFKLFEFTRRVSRAQEKLLLQEFDVVVTCTRNNLATLPDSLPSVKDGLFACSKDLRNVVHYLQLCIFRSLLMYESSQLHLELDRPLTLSSHLFQHVPSMANLW